jgi:hypothetical protein
MNKFVHQNLYDNQIYLFHSTLVGTNGSNPSSSTGITNSASLA